MPGGRRLAGRLGRGRLAAPDPAPPARAPGRARLERERRDRARVHGFPRHLRGGVAQGLPRPAPGEPVQRRLLAAGDRARRAADPPDPQQHGRARGWSSRTPRASATSASTRSTSTTRTRCARRTSTRSTRTAPRRSRRQEGVAITFMAKFDEREGNSCHIHFSLAGRAAARCSRASEPLFKSFLAGQLACLRELTLLLAPNINSYKRYAAGSFAPTTVAWGHDNRTCSLRVVGHGPSLRFENRVGGADLNPYLALQRDHRLGPARRRRGPRARARARGQRLRGARAPAAAADAARRAGAVRRTARSPAARSATRSSTTTSTRRMSSWRRSRRRSPTGSACEDSSDCERRRSRASRRTMAGAD